MRLNDESMQSEKNAFIISVPKALLIYCKIINSSIDDIAKILQAQSKWRT